MMKIKKASILLLAVIFSMALPAYVSAEFVEETEPLLYWDFNEGEGNVINDLSGNGHTGSFYNNDFSWVEGYDGTAVYVGANTASGSTPTNYIKAADTKKLFEKLAGAPQITVMMDVKRVKDAPGTVATRGTVLRLCADNDAVTIQPYQGKLAVYGRSDSADTLGGGDLNMEYAEWKRVAITYDYTNDKIITYVNGAKVAEIAKTWTTKYFNYIPSEIAQVMLGNNYIINIDNFKIYNRALTEEEFNKPELVAKWSFEDNETDANGMLTFKNSCRESEGTPMSLVQQSTATIKEEYGIIGKGIYITSSAGTDFKSAGNASAIVNSRLTGANGISMAMWVMVDETTPFPTTGGAQRLFGINESNSRAGFEFLNYRGKAGIGCRSSNQGSEGHKTMYTDDTVLKSDFGTWKHISATLDFKNKTAALYVNGVLAQSAENVAFPTDVYSYGAINGITGGGLTGMHYDEIAIYRNVLTAEEIAELYSARPEAQYTYCYADEEGNDTDPALKADTAGYYNSYCKYENKTENPVTVTLVANVYETVDGVEMLRGIGVSETLTVNPGETPTLSATVFMDSDTYFIRSYVWECVENPAPVSDFGELK